MLIVLVQVIVILSIFGLLADNPVVFITLTLINLPLYRVAAIEYFGTEDHAKDSMSTVGGNEFDGTDEEQWLNIKGLFFIAICATIVTAQYKLLTWLFF